MNGVSVKSQQDTPIIVGGFFRSGTSLVRRLLDSHSAISCVPEVKFFRDFFSNYSADRLAHLRFFSSVRSTGLSEKELLDIFGHAFIKCHEQAAKMSGKRRWADKNPENLIYLPQWQQLLGENFIFVHVVRNPLDTLASLNEAGFRKTIPEEFEDKVTLFDEYLTAAQCFCDSSRVKKLLVRYEDLVTRPQETLRHLLLQLGETYEKKMLDEFYQPARGSGLEDKKVSDTRTIHQHSLGRWQKDLTSSQQKMVIVRLQQWFTEFDYNDVL